MAKLEDLQDKLDSEIAWRKKEIVAIRSAISKSTSYRGYFCRAGLVLLCAHWEGFLKSSLQYYMDFVFSQQVPLKALAANFVSISLYKDIKTAAAADYPGAEHHGVKFAKRLIAGLDGPSPRPRWRIETGGSPSSIVTSRLLATVGLNDHLGLDEAEWSATSKFIDEQILKDRHKIAHGEGLPVDRGEFVDRSVRVIHMCEVLIDLIINDASNERYLSSKAA